MTVHFVKLNFSRIMLVFGSRAFLLFIFLPFLTILLYDIFEVLSQISNEQCYNIVSLTCFFFVIRALLTCCWLFIRKNLML